MRKRKLGRLPLPVSLRKTWRAGKSPRTTRGKRYDEALLVELIARGDLGCKEIGDLVGLSHSMVWQVAHGHKRPDLLPRIEEARGRHGRKEKKMASQILALAESAPPVPQKHKSYDDNELVEMLAAGTLSYAQIASKVGLTQQAVYRISCGKMRPDLLPRIREGVAAYRDQARQAGAAHLRNVVVQHVRQGIEGVDETARKCREYVMDNSLGEGPTRGRRKPYLCGAGEEEAAPAPQDLTRTPEVWEFVCLTQNGPDLPPGEQTALAALPAEIKQKIVAALHMDGEPNR